MFYGESAFAEIKDTPARLVIDATIALHQAKRKPPLHKSYANTIFLSNEPSRYYNAAAPFIIDTIIVTAHDNVLILSNQSLSDLKHGSSLVLPQHSVVRQFFVITLEPNFSNGFAHQWNSLGDNLRCLDALMKTAQLLGLGGYGTQFLKYALDYHNSYVDPDLVSWNCQRILVIGEIIKPWLSVMKTTVGLKFLARLTSLTTTRYEDRLNAPSD
ncbi:hypothetical protein C0991_002477, partial [Blastosporella zonata]